MNGLRDTGRILALSMWVLGFLRMLYGQKGTWLQVTAIFIMVTLKIDCFLPAAVMCLLSTALAIRKRLRRQACLPPLFFLLAAIAVCTMVWSYTGWFVPAPQYIAFLKGIL